MDTLKIASINFGNYALHLGQVNEILQLIVAVLSIFLLIGKVKGQIKKK